MKSLKDFKNDEIDISTVRSVSGGDGKTMQSSDNGNPDTDWWVDKDGDGVLSPGDVIWYDE